MTLVGIIVFFSVFFLTHYVSLGSILLYVSLIVCAIVFKAVDINGWMETGMSQLYNEYIIVIVLMTVMMLIRHKDNIKRLISGTERKTYLRSRPEIEIK
jgi:glycerol-3-phosphate acyltransferase PlsY